jgi:hypothetical protein
MTQGGVKVGGEYVLDPLTTAMPGDTMAAPGSTTGINGLTPISFGWDINGSPVSSGPASGGTGYSNGYNSSLSRGGIGAPGVANDGPNLGGTSVSGWFSDVRQARAGRRLGCFVMVELVVHPLWQQRQRQLQQQLEQLERRLGHDQPGRPEQRRLAQRRYERQLPELRPPPGLGRRGRRR